MSFYGFGRIVCGIFLKIAFKFSVVGKENLPTDENYILCSNHRTYMDPVFLGMGIPKNLFFMAKKELFEKPVLGPIIKKLGAFPVSRGKGDASAVQTAIDTVKNGDVLAIFPEGTRSKNGELSRFKSGAALIAHKTGASIVPACICFEGKLRFRSKVVVRFGKPIANSELAITGESPSQIKQASRLLQQNVEQLRVQGVNL